MADITVPLGDAAPSLDSLVIYGMTLSQMNQLSTVGASYNTYDTNNKMTITVSASDGDGQPGTVFQGDIMPGMTYVDGSDQPNVKFICAGVWGAANARKKIAPTTRQGGVGGETLIQQLAQQMGYRFENNGVKVQLRNPYLWGTGISQVRQCVQAMNCQWLGHLQTLAIWPNGKSRQGVFTVGPGQGLVGYPQFNKQTMRIVVYYNPAWVPGSKIQMVGSSLTAANGMWNTGYTTYELDCLQPHGRWFMNIMCYKEDATNPGGNQG